MIYLQGEEETSRLPELLSSHKYQIFQKPGGENTTLDLPFPCSLIPSLTGAAGKLLVTTKCENFWSPLSQNILFTTKSKSFGHD